MKHVNAYLGLPSIPTITALNPAIILVSPVLQVVVLVATLQIIVNYPEILAHARLATMSMGLNAA